MTVNNQTWRPSRAGEGYRDTGHQSWNPRGQSLPPSGVFTPVFVIVDSAFSVHRDIHSEPTPGGMQPPIDPRLLEPLVDDVALTYQTNQSLLNADIAAVNAALARNESFNWAGIGRFKPNILIFVLYVNGALHREHATYHVPPAPINPAENHDLLAISEYSYDANVIPPLTGLVVEKVFAWRTAGDHKGLLSAFGPTETLVPPNRILRYDAYEWTMTHLLTPLGLAAGGNLAQAWQQLRTTSPVLREIAIGICAAGVAQNSPAAWAGSGGTPIGWDGPAPVNTQSLSQHYTAYRTANPGLGVQNRSIRSGGPRWLQVAATLIEDIVPG